MDKLSKKNLFVEISDENILVAYGKYDDELKFQIIPSILNKSVY